MKQDVKNILKGFGKIGYSIFDGYIHVEIKGNDKVIIVNKMTLEIYVKMANITIKEGLLLNDLLNVTNKLKKDKR